MSRRLRSRRIKPSRPSDIPSVRQLFAEVFYVSARSEMTVTTQLHAGEAVKQGNCRDRNVSADIVDEVDRVVELESRYRAFKALLQSVEEVPPTPKRGRASHRQRERRGEQTHRARRNEGKLLKGNSGQTGGRRRDAQGTSTASSRAVSLESPISRTPTPLSDRPRPPTRPSRPRASPDRSTSSPKITSRLARRSTSSISRPEAKSRAMDFTSSRMTGRCSTWRFSSSRCARSSTAASRR